MSTKHDPTPPFILKDDVGCTWHAENVAQALHVLRSFDGEDDGPKWVYSRNEAGAFRQLAELAMEPRGGGPR